jgi:toxin ParE1/3/4
MHINWTNPALHDLEYIHRYYVAQGSPSTADAMHAAIFAAAEAIGEMPQRGRPGRIEGTRELVVPHTPYIIAYRPSPPRPDILAVIHGARMWPESL